MIYVTIDSIVKSVLLRRGYSMHWYLQFLKYAGDCVRELGYSTLRMVKTTVVVVDEYGQIPYPCDYEQYVRVGVFNGQYVRPLVRSGGGMHKELSRDAAGNTEPYPAATNSYSGTWTWLLNWVSNTNEYNEATGGYYGYGAGYEVDLFQEMPNRRVIQLSQEQAGKQIVLDYLPNVGSPDNLCRIPQMAQSTIEQYIVWQMKEHARHYQKHETKDDERLFWNEVRHLRARLTPMSTDDILRIFRRGYYSTIKA